MRILFWFAEEEYKRLSEALADEGTYNAVAFRYSADYYDPSQPTEEEEANKEAGGIRTSLETTQLQKPHTYFELLLESAWGGSVSETSFCSSQTYFSFKMLRMKRGHFP